MSEETKSEKDELRPCPTCRMPISILATRCRYCGDTVGRPRREQERLTVEDLGGTTATNYTISSDVMDALEAFRAEVLAEQDAHRREKEASQSTWFGHRAAPEEGVSEIRSGSGLPELDQRHRDLASIVDETAPRLPAHLAHPARRVDWPRRVMIAAGVIAALVMLYFVGGNIGKRIQAELERRRNADVIVYQNKALEMLKSGSAPVEALEEAMEALKYNNTRENKDIAAEVRQKVIEQVDAMLGAEPWNPARFGEASWIASHAALLDADAGVQNLVMRVNEEVASYKLILVSVDKETGKATFKLHNPNYPQKEQKVGVGDYVQDRFLVRAIGPTVVQLDDIKARTPGGHRRLTAPLLDQLEAG